MERGFVFLDEVLPGIRWDAKYATWDNFTGTPVDGYEANRIVGSLALAAALLEVTQRAAAAGFGVLLWDAYRPQRAVDRFLEWSCEPEDGRTKDRFYPNIDRAEMFSRGYVAPRSGHSRGSAVDLTLFRLDTGELAPMGGGHDLMDARSHHGAAGVSATAAAHRRQLCSLMQASGFEPYEREWWHYVLADEPHPDTYFDFPVCSSLDDERGDHAEHPLVALGVAEDVAVPRPHAR
jgi:D-alanyl-D-alanine dipeptidase